jgi:hypothetical protein
MGNIRAKVSLTLLIIMTTLPGCLWHNVDYSKFDNRCKQWTTQHTLEKDNVEYIKTAFPDIESRYAYYMCINIASGSMSVFPNIFYDEPEKSIALLNAKIASDTSDMETWLLVDILQNMQTRKIYNVKDNHKLTNCIKYKIATMKDKDWQRMTETKLNLILNN